MARDRHSRVRLLAVVAVAGQLGFVASWIAGALVQPGYSTRGQPVSDLFARTADHPWVLWIGLAVLVPSYLSTATILRRTLGPPGRAAAALFGLAVPLVIVVLVSPLDCMEKASAACAARIEAGNVSAAHDRHGVAAVALQLTLIATPFAVATAVRGTRLLPWALGFGAVGAATILAVAATDGDGYGIAQRGTFGFVNVWVIVVAGAALAGIRGPAART